MKSSDSRCSITQKILNLLDTYNNIDETDFNDDNISNPIFKYSLEHQNTVNKISDEIINNDIVKIYYSYKSLKISEEVHFSGDQSIAASAVKNNFCIVVFY